MNSMSGKLPSREEIDGQYKWKLEDLYPDDKSWEKDFEQLAQELEKASGFKGRLGKSGGTLLSWLRIQDDLDINAGKLGNYAFRRYDENTAVTHYQGLMDRVMSMYAKLAAETAWVRPELLGIPDERIDTFLRETEGLAEYAHYIDDVRRMEPHTLSMNEEEILALSLDAMSAPSTIFGMFNDADIRFGSIRDENDREVEVTKGRYIQLQESRDRCVREQAFRALYSEYAKWKNTLASTFGSQVKREMFYARTRKYSSTRQASLFSNNIPLEVYDNVLRTVKENLQPLHRAIALRKRILGVDSVRPWDLNVPLAGDADIEFPFSEAVGIVEKSLHVLGEQYAADLRTGLHGGWIDVYENQGKTSGAYSAWTYGAHPFILLNYTNTLKDVFTLAHEMGHSMHSWYTWKHQPPVYGGYTIFCAEVASTCNEVLLVDYLLKNSDDRELKLQLLFHYIDTIRGTVYNQALFAEFEQITHATAEKGQPLTVDILSGVMGDLYQRFYGPDFEQDELFALNWSRIPHFYRSFYVFQYATGLSAAVALATRILDSEADALENYMEFLKAGSSKYSIDLLRNAGVDMLNPDPIKSTADLMTRLLDKVDELL